MPLPASASFVTGSGASSREHCVAVSFRVADSLIAGLAGLTGEEQKVVESTTFYLHLAREI